MNAMRRDPCAALSVLLGIFAGALLVGCGSQTKTVTVASSQPASATTSSGATPTSTSRTTTNGATAAPTTTRTAPEPVFTQQEAHAEGLSGAAALVRAKGFTPDDSSQYHPNQTLRVLIATRTGSGDGYNQQAFFFLDGRYIGTDTREASATVTLVSQGDTEVTLAYPLYRNGDPNCCAAGGRATVHFQLNNGRLTALDSIPPVNSTSGFSRR